MRLAAVSELCLPIQRIRAVLEDAFHPLVKEEPRAINKLVQHARRQQVGQFELEMMNELLIHTRGSDRLSLSGHERASFQQKSKSDNNAGTIEICVWFSKRGDDAITSPFGWAEINKQNLVVIMVDDGA